MKDTTRALEDALDDLRTVFSCYGLSAVKGCPCCVTADDQAALRAGLRRHAVKDRTTWGNKDDFRHFLPDLFRASIHGDRGVDFDGLVGKLYDAGWTEWPTEEQAAIHHLLMVLWEHLLALETGPLPARDFLVGVAQVSDLTPYGEVWRKTDTMTSALRLAECLSWDDDPIIVAAVRGGGQTDVQHQFANLIRQDWIKERLEAAFFAATNDEQATQLSAAVETVEWLRKMKKSNVP